MCNLVKFNLIYTASFDQLDYYCAFADINIVIKIIIFKSFFTNFH